MNPWPVVASFALGIVWSPPAVIVACALCVGLRLAMSRRRPWGRSVAIALIALGSGAWSASLRAGEGDVIAAVASSVPRCGFSGRVTERVGVGVLVAIERATCADRAPVEDPGTVIVDDLDADAGTTVQGDGWFVPLGSTPFDAARKRAGAGALLDPIELHESRPTDTLHSAAHRYRVALRSAASILEPRRSGLLLGLTIGDTSTIDEATTENLRAAGLAHLVAVSGSNVAIVLAAAAAMLAPASRAARLTGCFLVLAFFVVVVGPEPSVLRAAVMGAIGLIAIVAGVRADPVRVLALALVVVLAARPQMLASAGLHLSAAATAGIVLLSGPISRIFRRWPPLMGRALGATLGAQCAVAPLLVAYFERVPIAGLPANLLAMPAVAPITVLGLFAGVAGTVGDSAANLAVRLTEPFIAYILWIGDVFGTQPWAAPKMPRWTAWLMGGAVAAATVASAVNRGHSR